jgi:uncharacterized protein YndB with AHSA1/START domain
MHIEQSIVIEATPARVFEVMTDVERWPEWSPSMRRVERLDGGAFGVGSAARISQPGAPAAVWRVTALTPDESFEWLTARPGMSMRATHAIRPHDGGCTVTLTVDTSGVLAALLTPLIGGTAAKFVDMEARGLKRRAEKPSYLWRNDA